MPQLFSNALAARNIALPINLQKGEQVVWGFPDTKYEENKTETHREYVGGSSGVSFRVMKGVWVHTGAHRGYSVPHEYTYLGIVGTGSLILTNKNVYFAGGEKSISLPYSKIVSCRYSSDGVTVMKDAASAKALHFITGDGPFTYNLITGLSNLSNH